LLALYPPIPSQGVPYGDESNSTYPSFGAQWRRDAAIGGDLVMIAQRRKTAREFVSGGVEDVFSYRFDTPLWNDTPPIGAQHFDNVVFSFQNISGALGPLPEFENYRELSRGIGRAYASFVWEGQPNGALGVTGGDDGNVTGLPLWPRYELESPKNIVLNANGSWVEADTWREEGIAFINSISRELLA
ncbi:hypothetical protein KC355_g4057, partial [Hortaea werneckii]